MEQNLAMANYEAYLLKDAEWLYLKTDYLRWKWLRLWQPAAWVQILMPLFTNYMTLGQSLNSVGLNERTDRIAHIGLEDE